MIINGKLISFIDCNDTEVISQCFEFYESVITENNLIITFVMQRLAEQNDIQQRLYDEMIEIKNRIHDINQLTYDDVNAMKYAEMVINEGLRMCPIATELKRRATKMYKLKNGNGETVTINPGDAIWLPAFILQNDPQYYPNPSLFDPERFNDSNRKDHVSATYAPFGIGPRDCIGCLYAMVEVKITLFHLLINFQIDCINNDDNHHIKLMRRQHSDESIQKNPKQQQQQ